MRTILKLSVFLVLSGGFLSFGLGDRAAAIERQSPILVAQAPAEQSANQPANTTNAADNGGACPKKNFFFLPPWHEYLESESDPKLDCAPIFNFPKDILPVALAIIDMLLRLAGLIAIFSVIVAGVTYITAGGAVEKTVTAKRRIYNALIGLGIVSIAAGVVAFIGNKLV